MYNHSNNWDLIHYIDIVLADTYFIDLYHSVALFNLYNLGFSLYKLLTSDILLSHVEIIFNVKLTNLD